MARSFDDIHALVPADMSNADSRAYEAKILELLRDHLRDSTEVNFIEVRGKRPDTEIVFCLKEPDHKGRREVAYRIWDAAVDDFSKGLAQDPASVAGWAHIARIADELEAPTQS